MQLPVLIEPLPNQSGFAARLGAPFDLRAEGATAEDARQRLAVLLGQRLQGGVVVSTISVPAAAPAGGWLPDDELTRDWLREVQQYRQECDEADRRRLLGDAEDEKAAS